MLSKNLKIAVVGIVKMGLLHASILNTIPDVELVALCDKSFLIRKFLKKVFNEIFIVKDIEKLSKLDLDAVYVTTPISSHYHVVKDVYSENIASNLFVEKTLASNFGQAKELCDLARDLGGVTMVGYMRRFAVTFRKAKELLDDKSIGDLIRFEAYAYCSDFYGLDGTSKVRACNVGVVRELGSHAIDIALWFFGDLEVRTATVGTVVNNGVEDFAYVEVRASNSLLGKLNISWCVDKHRIPEVGFRIKGSEGVIDVNDDKVELTLKNESHHSWFRHDLKDTVAFWLGGPEYFREDEHFVNSVISNNAAEPSFYTGARVDQIIDEIKQRVNRNA